MIIWWLKVLCFIILVILLLALICSWIRQGGYNRIIFNPPRPSLKERGNDNGFIYTKNGISYWKGIFLDDNCNGKRKRKRATLIVYLHGRCGNIASAPAYFESLRKEFHDPLIACAIEYVGYSPRDWGKILTTPNNAVSASRDVIIELQKQHPGCRLVIIGRSIGTGVACKLATLFPELRRLVLVSPFRSIYTLALDHFRPSFTASFLVPRDLFDNERIIASLPSRLPILFMHGKRDDIINAEHSQHLFNISRSKYRRIFIDSADHININHASGEVANFLRQGSCSSSHRKTE